MSHTTATTVYSLAAVVSSPTVAADTMAAAVPGTATLTGSYVDGDRAVVSFRLAGGDPAAMQVADVLLALLGDLTSATLSKGVGVHHVVVATS
jgi:hypothetical protein